MEHDEDWEPEWVQGYRDTCGCDPPGWSAADKAARASAQRHQTIRAVGNGLIGLGTVLILAPILLFFLAVVFFLITG